MGTAPNNAKNAIPASGWSISIESGSHAGVSSQSPLNSDFFKGFILTADEQKDLLAFLNSLTDESFVNDPKLGPPTDIE